jgi:predicted Rossmann fold flavoprotein
LGKRVYVAGGGAAGMCAAIHAARNGAKVTIIEKNETLGKKLSMTGNGRCNLTNLDMRAECFNSAATARMRYWLSAFGPEDTIDFFKSLGVVTLSEEGYIYPVSGQARTVVLALENEIKRLGIELRYKEQFKGVENAGEGGAVIVVTNKGRYEADACIIAAGSMSGPKSTLSTGDGYYICKKLGMDVKDTHPALVGFKCGAEEVMPAQGVRCESRISFVLGNEELTSEEGELQITAEGISGIPVMQASRDVIKLVEEGKPVFAVIDFFPGYDDERYSDLKKEMMKLRDDRTLQEFLLGFSNSNVTEMILSRMKLSKSMKMKNISESMAECVLDSYRALKLAIVDSFGYQASQVTTGGVSLGDIGDDLSFVGDKRIFVIGELLDVDGRCGGYNLQWAFTSGAIAGKAAAMKVDG